MRRDHRTSMRRAGGGALLGMVTVRTPSLQVGADHPVIDRVGEVDAAAKLPCPRSTLMVVSRLSLSGTPPARMPRMVELTVLHRNVDLLAAEAWQLGGDDVTVFGFVDVDGRRPGASVLDRIRSSRSCQAQQIPQRVAPRNHWIVAPRGTVLPFLVCLLQGFTGKPWLIDPGDTAREGHADQARERPVPGPRSAPFHSRQQARHVQARMRNIRTRAQSDNKFRAEEDVERAILDEREMQYLYRDGDFLTLHGHRQLRAAAHRQRSARRRRRLPHPRHDHQGGVLRRGAGRHRAAGDGRSDGESRPCPGSRARRPAPRSSRRHSRPDWSSRCRLSST